VCLAASEPITAGDDYGSLAGRLEVAGGELLVRALDERPPFVDQPDEGVTYAHKIEASDRALDPARTVAELERVVRALRPHIGARLALPGGGFLGVDAARPGGPPVERGHVRAVDGTLALGAADGTLELTAIRPPGGRAMAAADWLRGRPDPALTDFAVPAG
jgi:methionyl-tRNA formyltransferase